MDGNVYVYDFSELREEVKNVETQISELAAVQSVQASVQSEQFSEMVSVIGNTTDYISATKQCTEIEVILLIAVILFCGFISGLLIVNLIRK